uniref:Tetratricopeptide SHNi-TPR domain-containing protein n=1 Tax=Panagrolaimus sp. PS1159 TaxID=55785 RepID=A0AC35F3A8_9BILA
MVAANDNTTEQPEINPEVPAEVQNAEEEAAEVELTKDEKLAAIPTLMAEGQRAFLTNDYELAAEKFSIATEYSVSVYEDVFAPECYEPHYNYGRALTCLAELESENPQVEFASVREYISKMTAERAEKLQGAKEQPNLDDSRIGNPDEITGEERDEIVAAVDTALEENAQELDKLGEKSEETAEELKAKEEEPTADAKEKPMEANGEAETEAADTTVESAGKEDVDMDKTVDIVEEDAEMEDGEEDDDEEEIASANIAWDVLEVARKICEKHGDGSKEWDLKMANVLSVLGQLSIADDKYENAIADLQTALEIAQKHQNDRYVASAHYELGVAYRINDDYLKASECMKKAKDILVARYESLKAGGDNEEVKDLEEIIKDVSSAFEDCQGSYKDSEKKKALKEKEDAKQISPEKPKENLEPASDITSNIRKGKRPAEVQAEKEESKKAKVEEEPAAAAEIPADA